jgi:hypothetical protein
MAGNTRPAVPREVSISANAVGKADRGLCGEALCV